MTFGAHVIPVLLASGPVQGVGVSDDFIAIDMEPALATLFIRPGIPGRRQYLQAPVRKCDQILLQRCYAECEFNLVVLEFTACIVHADRILAVSSGKRARYAEVLEFTVCEIAEYRVLARHLHCFGMV